MKTFYQCDVAESDSDSIWTSSVIWADSVEEAQFQVMLELQQDWGDGYMPDNFIERFGSMESPERGDQVFPGIEAWNEERYWNGIPATTGMLKVPAAEALAQLGKIEEPSAELVDSLMAGDQQALLMFQQPITVAVTVSGGVLQWAGSDVDVTDRVRLIVVDFDQDGVEEGRLVDMAGPDEAREEWASVYPERICPDREEVTRIIAKQAEREEREERFDNNRCILCNCDLDDPSAAGAEDGICGPCIAGDDEEGTGNG